VSRTIKVNLFGKLHFLNTAVGRNSGCTCENKNATEPHAHVITILVS